MFDLILDAVNTSTRKNSNLDIIKLLMNHYEEWDDLCTYYEFMQMAAELNNYELLSYFVKEGGNPYPLYDIRYADASTNYLKYLLRLEYDGGAPLLDVQTLNVLQKEIIIRHIIL